MDSLNSRTSSNSSSWLDRILSLEMISDDILEDLSAVSDIVNKNQDSYGCRLESLLGSMHDLSQRPGLVKFLRNAILLLLDVFPRNHVLEEAILVTTEMYTAQQNSSSTANTSRALAKNLLKKDRKVWLFFCCLHYFVEELNMLKIRC